jgi:hypothetical protein
MGRRGIVHLISTLSSNTLTDSAYKVAAEHPMSQAIVVEIRDQSQNVK